MMGLSSYKLTPLQNRRFMIFYFSFSLLGFLLWFFLGLGWFFLMIFIRHLLFGVVYLYILVLQKLISPEIAGMEKELITSSGGRFIKTTNSLFLISLYAVATIFIFWKVNISIIEIIHLVSSN